MSELRLVLFDCDGTLVDSAAHIVEAMQGAFTRHGLAPPAASDVRGIIGLSLPLAVAELCDDEDAVHDDLVAAYKAAYYDATAKGAATEPLFPGAVDMLTAVDLPPTMLGVATGKSRRGLDRILAGHGLGHHFVTTVTADDAASKPSPDMVHRALALTGALPSRTLVVGDSAFDMTMARAAGAFAIGVAWGYHPVDRLQSAGAHKIAYEMADIPHLIDGLVSP